MDGGLLLEPGGHEPGRVDANSALRGCAVDAPQPAQKCVGSNGTVQVTQTAIKVAVGPIVIATGKGDQTTALQNTFAPRRRSDQGRRELQGAGQSAGDAL
jgi:hypothetical protein